MAGNCDLILTDQGQFLLGIFDNMDHCDLSSDRVQDCLRILSAIQDGRLLVFPLNPQWLELLIEESDDPGPRFLHRLYYQFAELMDLRFIDNQGRGQYRLTLRGVIFCDSHSLEYDERVLRRWFSDTYGYSVVDVTRALLSDRLIALTGR